MTAIGSRYHVDGAPSVIRPENYWHQLEPLAYVEYCLASAVDAYNNRSRARYPRECLALPVVVWHWFRLAQNVARDRLTRDEWIAAISRIEPE